MQAVTSGVGPLKIANVTYMRQKLFPNNTRRVFILVKKFVKVNFLLKNARFYPQFLSLLYDNRYWRYSKFQP